MTKNQAAVQSPLVRIVAPTAAMTTGLLSPSAWTAPGDLDPTFGDVGRVHSLQAMFGTAWAVESGEDQDVLLGGYSEYFCYYSYYDQCHFDGFAGHLQADGAIDSTFATPIVDDTDVFDLARQADGKIVGVGSRHTHEELRLAVFRLNSDGSPDPDFGSDGVVQPFDGTGPHSRGQTVLLEQDGRIVVAGSRAGHLVLVRLDANGGIDAGFGAGGVFEGPLIRDTSSSPRAVRVSNGYRVTAHAPDQCQVVAITLGGELDSSFGTGGLSGPVTGGGDADECTTIAAQPDGALLLAGSSGTQDQERAFAVRLLPSGALDAGFSGAAVGEAMLRATALAVDGRGAITVAGVAKDGLSGALVMRLQASGFLDALFGNAGSTWLELPTDQESRIQVHDMQALSDGGILLGGGDDVRRAPFVARLLGDAGGGPGVLGVKFTSVPAVESTGQTVVNVRRMGGSSGAVSVAYQAVTERSVPLPATAGEDYGEVSGRLEWADGDYEDKSIIVPLVTGESFAEGPENFAVMLSAPQGGAGLGSQMARVAIRGDGYPSGLFLIEAVQPIAAEGTTSPLVLVSRMFYAQGDVSVTVQPVAGTATPGADFDDTPVTLTWRDGVSSSQLVYIPLHSDGIGELSESFSVVLSDPTGGATIGPQSSAAITFTDEPKSGGSGGGGAGGLAALLLGLIAILRRVRMRELGWSALAG